MKPNYIFGLTRRLIELGNNNIRNGWIISVNSTDYHMDVGINVGTPCTIIKYTPTIHQSARNSTHNRQIVLLPFTIRNKLSNRLVLDNRTNTRSIVAKVGDKTSFFEDIQTINIGTIDTKKILRAIELVKGTAPITLIIDSRILSNVIVDELLNLFSAIDSRFKYRFNGGCTFNGRCNLIANDKSILTITVMDIAQCIPIMYPNQVDGILLHISTMYTERSKQEDRLVNSCEMTFYFSNYLENIYTIDGQRTCCTKCSFGNIISLVNKSKDYLSDIGKVGNNT